MRTKTTEIPTPWGGCPHVGEDHLYGGTTEIPPLAGVDAPHVGEDHLYGGTGPKATNMIYARSPHSVGGDAWPQPTSGGW